MCYTIKLKMLSFYSELDKRLFHKLLLIPVSIENILYYLSFHLLMKWIRKLISVLMLKQSCKIAFWNSFNFGMVYILCSDTISLEF